MVENFLDSLNCNHRTWKYCKWGHIPYNTIFQSSGYGKSRLVKEVAKRIPTIHLCLRDAGYPLRTSAGADLFERVLRGLTKGAEEWRFLYVLQVAIQCFKEVLANCSDNNEFWNKQMDTEYCERIWTDVHLKSSDWNTIQRDKLISSANFLIENTTNDNNNVNVRLIFCIDEARVLISPTDRQNISSFRFLCRALREIYWNGFFVLFLDTLSKISNFVPPKSADSSSRDTSDLPFKLFYPFFRLTTMDAFKSSDVFDNESWNLAKFGRPLYMSYLQSHNEDPYAVMPLKNLRIFLVENCLVEQVVLKIASRKFLVWQFYLL
jgi:hypothetical protein